jgi:hypothetical protein
MPSELLVVHCDEQPDQIREALVHGFLYVLVEVVLSVV